jgi:ABC-type transport system substrate-binding protein
MATEMFDVRLRRNAFVLTVATVLVLGMLAPFMAVLPKAEAASVGGKYGGDYKVALIQDPGAINPLVSTDENTGKIIDLVYDSLARLNPATLELVPCVAKAWTIDGNNVTVELKNGVLWHDGTAVTVDDVAYTYEIAGYAPDSIASITTNDTLNTVTFTLAHPDGEFLIDGLLLKLVPQDFTETSDPMGCGPFVYDSEVDNSSLKLTAFEDYYNGRAYVDSINYTVYGAMGDIIFDLMNETVDSIGFNLKVSEVNLNVSFKGRSMTLMEIGNNTFSPNWTVVRSFGTDVLYLGYNCAGNNTLSDLALRQAITYCIDKPSISSLDVSGSAEVTNSIISARDIPWYNSSIKTYDFDLVKANEILDDAGYFDLDGDGWRDKVGSVWNDTTKTFTAGGPFALSLLLPEIEEDLTLSTIGDQILEQFIENIGINVTLNFQPKANMPGIIAADAFDMYLGIEDRASISPLSLKPMFYSENIATDENYMNFEGTTTQVNGTVVLDALNSTGQLSRTNIVDDSRPDMVAWKNGVRWGLAEEQPIIPSYNGTDYALLGNTTILPGTFKLYKNDVLMNESSNYTLDRPTGNLTLLTGAGAVLGDEFTATYGYDTYVVDDYKLGTITILDNCNLTADTLTVTFDYRGVDDAMDKMAGTLNSTELAYHAKEAQGFLSDHVPYAPITTYKVLNAYVTTKYIGWQTAIGGIVNYWSMVNLQNNLYDGTTLRQIVVTTSAYPGYVESGGELALDISVADGQSNPLEGVILELENSDGTIGAITDNADGTYSATFTAPDVTNTKDITISTMAALSGYVAGFTNTSITVHVVTHFFSIEVTSAASTMSSGNETAITVLVTDEDGLPVSGADVSLTVEPAGVGGWIDVGLGTTDTGGSFSANLKTQNVSVDTTFRVVAEVSMVGYQPDSATANVVVSRYGGVEPDRGLLGLPGIGTFVSLAAIGMAAVLFGVSRKRKKQ